MSLFAVLQCGQRKLNTELDIEGLLLTMFDVRLRLSNQVVDEVKMHFQTMMFDTIIQRNTKLGEAPSHGSTIIMHDASCKGAINYLNLAREILQKNEMTKMTEEEKTIALEGKDGVWVGKSLVTVVVQFSVGTM